MKLLPDSLSIHRSEAHKSHKLRWFVLIAAAAFAVAWRTQTAISRAPQRLKAALGGPDAGAHGGTATQERPAAGDQEKPASQATATNGRSAKDSGSEAPSQAAENPASTAEGDVDAARADLAAPPDPAGSQPARAAGDATAPTPPETEPAGIDDSGTFRPTKAEPDEFGVVVTDDEPSGLAGSANWVEGLADGSCPDDHPIKGNASSRIYHVPGGSSYNQTHAELCFASEEDATAAGYRPRANR